MANTGTWVYRNGRLIEKHKAGPLIRSDAAPMIVSDLKEYRAAAFDKASGSRPVIGGRRQHREFLKANGYREVGNDYVAPRREEMSSSERVSDIKRAMRD